MKKNTAEKYSLRRLSFIVYKEFSKMPYLSGLIICLIILAEMLHFAVPYFVQRFVDGVVDGSLVTLNPVSILFWFVLPIAGVGLISNLIWRGTGFIASEIAPRTWKGIVLEAYHEVFNQSYRFLQIDLREAWCAKFDL